MEKILIYGMTGNVGGIETYILNMIKECEITDLHFDFLTHFKPMAYQDELEKSGMKVFCIPSKHEGLINHLRQFGRFLRRHKSYHTIYFNVMDARVFPTVLLAKMYGRKTVVHSHNGDMNISVKERVFRFFLKRVTDQRMGCSESACRYLFGQQKKNGLEVVIHNKIPIGKYIFNEAVRKKYRLELGIKDGQLAICHVGRITNQKNPFGIVDIFAAVLSKQPDALLISAGTGELLDEMKQYAMKKNVFDHIRFLGIRKDIPDIMQAADVFILPSLYEGLPIVGVEAQAADLPCVFADTITKETCITENVMFLPLGNEEIWADTILRFWHLERKNQSQALRDAGYDLQHPNDLQKLVTCLKG